MSFNGKVAVVTGGASGMGLATVNRFLEEGAKVVIADFNAETGGQACEGAAQAGFSDSVSFIKTDVASETDIVAMIEAATTRFGGLDIVFNNAGVGGAIGPLTETTTEDWDYTFDVLAKGVFLGIKHAARVMKEQGRGGSIINTASIAGLSGDGGPMVYSAAKAAVISLSKSAAVELAADRIRVNAICPGGFMTEPNVRWSQEHPDVIEAFKANIPSGDFGQPEDLGPLAVYLASDASRYMTGAALVIDGGYTLW